MEIAEIQLALPETDDEDVVCGYAERLAEVAWPKPPTP
ncbi:hypothetical protein FHR84_001007 [Actinopolyspora biskrensis]|uniref:Uncharacterized protein n=1 Tax=Actinopolyspora biskrensis TaxID=1470178 RepID=A0A852Z661_9ACTN|nr:hypothetical protein [Actinopolyspora biskrensis]